MSVQSRVTMKVHLGNQLVTIQTRHLRLDDPVVVNRDGRLFERRFDETEWDDDVMGKIIARHPIGAR